MIQLNNKIKIFIAGVMRTAKKKARKKKHPIIDKSPVRKKKAKGWVKTYTGTDIVKDYRAHFKGVDVACAVRELKEIGYQFEPDYENNVLRAEAARINQIHRNKEKKQQSEIYDNDFQDDNFFFIAGHTSGGAPYGVTWEQMGLEPWDELDDDNIPFPENSTPAAPVLYSELDEEQREEVFSRMAEMIDDFILGAEYIPEKGDMDEILKELCDEMDGMYRLILVPDDSMRTAFNEVVEQIIADCKEDGIELPTFLDTLTITETERLKIRRLYSKDMDSLFNMMKIPEAMRDFENVFVKSKEARKWLNSQYQRYHKDGYGYFAVTLKDSDKFIGQAGFIKTETDGEKTTELVYIFYNTAFEQGYAYEAAQACVNLAFERYNIEKLYCKIYRENHYSIQLAERLGMNAEGSFIKQYESKDMEFITYSKKRK
jgi:RimJ/RimL family protein N-acetyltransferase